MKRAGVGLLAGVVMHVRLAARRRAARSRISTVGALLCLVALCLGVPALFGCSAGNGFSGGSVPVGLRSTIIRGSVVEAGNIGTVVPNAAIQVTSTFVPARAEAVATAGSSRDGTSSGTGGAVPVSIVSHAYTGSDGSFALTGIQTGNGTAKVTLVISAPASNVAPLTLSFTLHPGDLATVVAAMASGSVTTTQPGSVTLSPATLALAQGNSSQLTARLLDKSGQFIPISPSFVMVGNDTDLGTLTPGGLFAATAPGDGTITACWYNGLQSPPCYVEVTPSAVGAGQ